MLTRNLGTVLGVVEEAEMPHNEILLVYLTGSQGYSTEKILRLIEVPNDRITSMNWKLLRTVDEDPQVLLYLFVDPQSAEILTEMGL